MIETIHISKTVGEGAQKKQILTDVSFQLEKGKTLALMGKSGSGKTTLLNCLGGLDTPDSGQIRCFGVDIHSLSLQKRSSFQRRNLGFIFQSHNLFSYLTVLENINFPLVLNGVTKNKRAKRVDRLLETLGLSSLSDAMPAELSGGQAQRVAFARAVAHRPQMLLADEPTASLDTQTGLDLIRLMHKIGKEQGVTIIVATHDDDIIKYTDQTLVLNDGRIMG